MNNTTHHTEQHLFIQIAEGNEDAFREIFDTYNRKLFPFVQALVKSDADAREIMQDVFLKLWLQRETLPEIDNPGGWLRTVASNAAYDHLRRQASYESHLAKSQTAQPAVIAEDDVWKKIDAKEVRHLVDQAIRELPQRRRQIFQLSKIEGFSRKEIAEQLNISENTVRNQLVEAIEFVQQYLQRNGSVFLPVSVLWILFCK